MDSHGAGSSSSSGVALKEVGESHVPPANMTTTIATLHSPPPEPFQTDTQTGEAHTDTQKKTKTLLAPLSGQDTKDSIQY